MPKKASLCCLKTWWKWAIWVLIEWETKYFIIYIFYHPGCSRPHHSSFHDLRICTLCPFTPEHIHPSVTHISVLQGSEIPSTVTMTYPFPSPVPMASSKLSLFPCPVAIKWERSSICCGCSRLFVLQLDSQPAGQTVTITFENSRSLDTGHTIAWPLIFKRLLVTKLFGFLLPCSDWLKMVKGF